MIPLDAIGVKGRGSWRLPVPIGMLAASVSFRGVGDIVVARVYMWQMWQLLSWRMIRRG